MTGETGPGITLLGTVHLDPGGHPRLRIALNVLRPAAVTVDVSPFAVEFRQTRGPELAKRLEPFRSPEGLLPPAFEPVEAQLAIPYELAAAEAYAREAGIPCTLLGDNESSKVWLTLFETELLDPGNLARLAQKRVRGLAEQASWEWATARRHWREKGPAIAPPDPAKETKGKRPTGVPETQAQPEPHLDEDVRMAALLRSLPWSERPGKCFGGRRPAQTRPDWNGLVHVTGWEHLGPLAALLGVPEARCFLAVDF